MIYLGPDQAEAISQGDIIDTCPIVGLEHDENDPTVIWMREWRERVIVLTQACDLAQTKTTKVLVALVHSAQSLADKGILKPGVIRDQLRRGSIYGWYFLPASTAPVEFPESIVDLRDLHTIPRSVLERLTAEGKRLCRLMTPYREHLAQHFAVTYMRIGLPSPYETTA